MRILFGVQIPRVAVELQYIARVCPVIFDAVADMSTVSSVEQHLTVLRLVLMPRSGEKWKKQLRMHRNIPETL